jgi:multisubunit Na+/H+ antiporter MnhC subunit
VERHLLADPVPQALILTAIVISMAVTLYLLATFSTGVRVLETDEMVRPAENDEGTDKSFLNGELAGRGRLDP